MASSFKKRTIIARSVNYSLKKLDYQRRYSLNKALWDIQLQQEYQCGGLSERAAKMLLEYAEWLIIIRGYETMEYSEELALAFMTYQLEQYVDLMRGTNGKGPKLTKTLSDVAWKAEKEFFNVFGGIDLGTRWDMKVMDLQGVMAVSPGDWNAPAVEDWKSLIRSLLNVEPSVETSVEPQQISESHEMSQEAGESQEIEEETDETVTRGTAFELEEDVEHEENLEDEAELTSLERKQQEEQSLPVGPVREEASPIENQLRNGISPKEVPQKQSADYHGIHAGNADQHHLDDENMQKLELSRPRLMGSLHEVHGSDKEETASEEGLIKKLVTEEDIIVHRNKEGMDYSEGAYESEKIENHNQDIDAKEIEKQVHEDADQDMDNDEDESLDLGPKTSLMTEIDTTVSEHSPEYASPDAPPFIDNTIPIQSSIQVSQREVQSAQPVHQICIKSDAETSTDFESQANFREMSTEVSQAVDEDQALRSSDVFAISSRRPSLCVPASTQSPVDLQNSSVPTHFNTLPLDNTQPQDDSEGEDALSTASSRVEVQVPKILTIEPSTNDQSIICQSLADIVSMVPESSLRDQLSKLSALTELVDEANTVMQEIKLTMASRSQNEETYITEPQLNSLLSRMEKSEESNVKSLLDILDLRLGKIGQDIHSFKGLIPTIRFIESESMRTSQIVKEDHDIFDSSIRSLKANLDSLLQMHGDAMRFTESHIHGLGGKTQQLACALSAMEARLKTDQSNKNMEFKSEISRLTNHFTQLGKNTLAYVQETKAAFQKFQPRLDSALKLSTDVRRDLETYVADDKSKILAERLKAIETNIDEISFSNMKEIREVKEENTKLKEGNKKLKEENFNLNRKISLLERKMDDQQKVHETKFKSFITEVSNTISKGNSSRDADFLRNNYSISLPLQTSEQQSVSPRVSSQVSPTRPFITAPSNMQRVPSSSGVAQGPPLKEAGATRTPTGQSSQKKKDSRKRVPRPQSTVSLVDSLFNSAPPRGVKRRTPPSGPLNFNENIDLKKIKLLKPNSS